MADFQEVTYNNVCIEWEVESNGLIEIDDQDLSQEEQIEYVKEQILSLVLDDQKFWILKVNGERV